MGRWLAILLVVLLPLQVSWAAVADFCAHEHGKAAQHFGHHDDEYHAWQGDKPSDRQEAPNQRVDGHQHSHLSGFLGLPAVTAVAMTGPGQAASAEVSPIHSSAPPDQPDRPNWQPLA